MKKIALNNTDRQQWIDNDEGLYNWFKASRTSMTKFIRENKDELDAIILKSLNVKPAEKIWRDYC